MTDLPVAQSVHRAYTGRAPVEHCTLDYDARFVRRKRLVTREGTAFVVDLPQTTSLDHGDGLALSDGRVVLIEAAQEDVLRVSGDNLARITWHIGNRHTPCQIMADHVLIQRDPVIGHMLEHLGAVVEPARAAFTPEGGAYGHGRTHSHEHGATAHAH